MAAPLIIPALLLALVLGTSGALKLRDSSTTADAFASLRLPAWTRTRHLPVLLAYGELLLGLALVVVPSPAYLIVALLTAVVFIAYLVVIVRALGFEERVECGCFGRLGLGEVDRRTAMRNAVLVVLALVAVSDGVAGRSVIQRLASFGAVEWTWLLGVAVAIVLTWLIVGRAADSVAGVAPAAREGSEELLDYDRRPIPYGALLNRESGKSIAVGDVGADRPALLVFLSITCGACMRTMEMLPGWAERHTVVRTIAVSPGAGRDDLPDLGAHITWLDDPDATLARTFAVSYPAAVLLGIDGMLAGGPESGVEEVSDFLDEISQQLAEAGISPDGSPSDPEDAEIAAGEALPAREDRARS